MVMTWGGGVDMPPLPALRAILASEGRGAFIDTVDQDIEGRANLRGESLGRDAGGEGHDRFVAFLLHVLGNLVVHRCRRGAFDRFEFERADAVEAGFLEPA